ncbi:toxin glutamine deamidase domain-containing protein, partial [Micromonospora sonneratiae]
MQGSTSPAPQTAGDTPPQGLPGQAADDGQRSDAVDVQLGPAPPTPHHDPASPVDDRRLLQSLPRGRDGRHPVHPDPAGSDWISWLNDGGPFTDGRRFNCVDSAIAALSTWFGHPRVAGSSQRTDGTERSVVEQWLGAPFGPVLQGEAGPARIETDLRALGHGAAAIVTLNYSHMSASHMLIAVNHRNTIYWIDGQNFTGPLPQPPYAGNITRSSALLLDARGVPVTRPTTQTIPEIEIPERLATGLDDETGPAEDTGDDARPNRDAEPAKQKETPSSDRADGTSRVDDTSRTDDVSGVDVEPELRPTTNLGPVYPSAVGRTGADLPQQVRDLVDQAKQRLLST